MAYYVVTTLPIRKKKKKIIYCYAFGIMDIFITDFLFPQNELTHQKPLNYKSLTVTL